MGRRGNGGEPYHDRSTLTLFDTITVMQTCSNAQEKGHVPSARVADMAAFKLLASVSFESLSTYMLCMLYLHTH